MEVDGEEAAATTMMDMGMKMYFHVRSMETILFKGWMTHNWQQMLGSCITVFIMAMLYEGFKVGRGILQHKNRTPAPNTNGDTPQDPEYGSMNSDTPLIAGSPSIWSKIFNKHHLLQSILQTIQVWISMSLMLIFMTYNVYLCIAVSLGAGVGYFAFAWLQTKHSNHFDHCI